MRFGIHTVVGRATMVAITVAINGKPSGFPVMTNRFLILGSAFESRRGEGVPTNNPLRKSIPFQTPATSLACGIRGTSLNC
jgi:hypothetical protein